MFASAALFVAIACLGMFVQATVGFAGAWVAVPIFSLFWPPREIIPIFVVVQMVVNLFLIWESRKHVCWHIVRSFLITGIPATYLGVMALVYLPTSGLKIFISVVTIVFAVLFLFKLAIRFKETTFRQMGAGALSGFLGGSIAVSGPPVVLYALAQNWQKDKMRATLIANYFFLNVFTVIFSSYRGLIPSEKLPYVVFAVPPILAISKFGIHIKNKLSEHHFRKIVLGILLGVSFLGLANLR